LKDYFSHVVLKPNRSSAVPPLYRGTMPQFNLKERLLDVGPLWTSPFAQTGAATMTGSRRSTVPGTRSGSDCLAQLPVRGRAVHWGGTSPTTSRR
jgi:hypothetical protein